MRRRHGGDKSGFFEGPFSCIGACADGMPVALCAVDARRRHDARSFGRASRGRACCGGRCSASCVRRRYCIISLRKRGEGAKSQSRLDLCWTSLASPAAADLYSPLELRHRTAFLWTPNGLMINTSKPRRKKRSEKLVEFTPQTNGVRCDERNQPKQTPTLSVCRQMTRQGRVERKLSKLNANDSAAGIVAAKLRHAPSFVMLSTMQSVNDDWLPNIILARLSTVCLASRRRSSMGASFCRLSPTPSPLHTA